MRGCTAVSEGCRNCYAARQAARYSGPGMPYEGLAKFTPHGPRWTGKIREAPDHLGDPLRWKKPRRVFVNSMSDLFHPLVSRDFILRVFNVMARAPQHTFQVLTKRPERMAAFLGDPAFWNDLNEPGLPPLPAGSVWPLRNVWLGTSVEDQVAAEKRVGPLIDTPAAVRFLSCEPLLGPVNLRKSLCSCPWFEDAESTRHLMGCPFYPVPNAQPIQWIIIGGESGPGARPMELAWIRSLIGDARRIGAKVFIKQLGSQFGAHKGGNPEEWPMDLRIREWPGGNGGAEQPESCVEREASVLPGV